MRPFFYFFDRSHAPRELLFSALASLGVTVGFTLLDPAAAPELIGLVSVVAMPFMTYAQLGYRGWRGALVRERWRSEASRKRHLVEETWHYSVRVVVAWSAAQFIAEALGPMSSYAAVTLPLLIYLAQTRAYHDMHVVMHARAQLLAPEEQGFSSRERRELVAVEPRR